MGLGRQCTACGRGGGFDKKGHWWCEAFPQGIPDKYRYDEQKCPKFKSREGK